MQAKDKMKEKRKQEALRRDYENRIQGLQYFILAQIP
jgi:hypothetical protein